MKAICIHEFGGPEVLRLEDLPVPQPAASQILVQVYAAGVNPVDGKIRAGKFKRFQPHLPAILGRDLSGVVIKTGPGVSGFTEGDAVFGMQDYSRGTYAEFSLALPSELALKPAELHHDHAACIGVAGLTAWQALFRCGGLQRGQRVLIHGGGGGVGHFAVQFAAGCGAEVIATVSPEDAEFVTRLGAAQVIDYKGRRFEEAVRDLDLVVDLIGGETRDRSWQVLKSGGTLVSTLGAPEPPADAPAGVRGREVIVECHSNELAEIAAQAASGKIRIEVDKVFPLADARLAHEHIENEHSHGKTVLQMGA